MKTKIWLALIALYIVWGSTYLGIKVAIETIPPFFHAAVRFFVSGLILVAWQRAAGNALPTRNQWKSTAIIGLFLLLGGNGLVSWAEQYIPSGIAALIIASMPVFLVVTEAIRPGGTKPSWRTIVGILVGFVGIYVLVSPGEISGGQHLEPVGIVALLSACLLWALGSTYSKTADLPSSSLMTTGAEMLMGSLSLLIVSFLSGELSNWNPALVSVRSIYGLLYLITVGSIIGFGSYIWLLQNAPISLVATYAYVNPIVAILLGSWLGSEPLNPRVWFAAIIIIGSIVFINTKSKPTAKKNLKEVATA